MAIPDTYTFSMSDICAELQFSGATGSPSATLSNMFIDAPDASYCSAYSGTTSCLRNYRGYALSKEVSCASFSSRFCNIEIDDVNGGIWGTFYGTANCIVRVDRNYAYSAITGTGVALDLAFDGTNMWYTGGAYKCVGKINTTTGVITKYTGGGVFGKCPTWITYDGTNMWATGFDIVDNTQSNRFYRITPSGVVSEYICTSICCGQQITYDGSDLWMASQGNNMVAKINPSTQAVTTYAVGSCPSYVTYDGTYIWTMNIGNNSVSRVTTGGSVTTFTGLPGNALSGRAFGTDGTHVWATAGGDCVIVRICQDGTMRTYYRDTCSFGGFAYDCDTCMIYNPTHDSPNKMILQGVK